MRVQFVSVTPYNWLFGIPRLGEGDIWPLMVSQGIVVKRGKNSRQWRFISSSFHCPTKASATWNFITSRGSMCLQSRKTSTGAFKRIRVGRAQVNDVGVSLTLSPSSRSEVDVQGTGRLLAVFYLTNEHTLHNCKYSPHYMAGTVCVAKGRPTGNLVGWHPPVLGSREDIDQALVLRIVWGVYFPITLNTFRPRAYKVKR
ncbi:hypothetical protein GGU10DRAFT_333142 [Lentinula aff. detonsa]|uniref:Uncharacterized protein n=1 Tax=Lentinula aff. detonsa TaxID=2804958 RepID=A0AA38NPK9_9AGAR|nr:hypothetical protein GGU10DRAFT_333142 [Lentinula aff. detonsa]